MTIAAKISRLGFVMIWIPVLAASGRGAETPFRVENRIPKEGEYGYRPADGAAAVMNPPSLIWPHESPAHTYAVQWARNPDFNDAETSGALPFNTYTHNRTWAAGEYWWRYRFTTKDGQTSDWSIARTVTVPVTASAMPMPDRVEQKQRVPAGHPRLFLRPEDLPRIRALAQAGESQRFAALRAEADRLIQAGPTPEPEHLGSLNNDAQRPYWWPNRLQTLKACEEAETLAFVFLITGEKKYGEAARRWILHLAAWNPDGPTNYQLNDEAAMPLLHRLPRAYDWAYDALTPEDRLTVQRAMLRRATDLWHDPQVGVGHLTRPFRSHANRSWHKLGECGIAFLGEIPEAADWLDYAMNKFYAAYPVWSDDDGGWHEGAKYERDYMSKVIWWLQVSRSALGVDGMIKPFFSRVGDFFLYTAPPGSPNSGFGDLSFRPPATDWGSWLEYYQRAASPTASNSAAWRWWTDRWEMDHAEGVMGFLFAANLPALPVVRPPVDLPPSKVFHGIGVASLHTTLIDSADDVHFLFKSSPFGTASHGHNAQNSFQLNAYGEALLIANTYRDWHGSPFHNQWVHSTRAQNAVLVNGEGQIPHSASAKASIVEEQLNGAWDYVAGDARPAYAGRLTRALRRVVFAKPDIIVIYDDLAAPQPATFQFMLHAAKPFAVNETKRTLIVEQAKAGVLVTYLPAAPLRFRQEDGYEPKPESSIPNLWRVEASTQEKTAECGMLTVLAPYRTGQRPDRTYLRLESPTAIGVQVLEAGRVIKTIAFRKSSVEGTASLTDLNFTGPVMVK